MLADPLSNYLKMFRKRSGLSQKELARLLGCSSGSKVSRYETGKRRPSFETLLAYQIAFRVGLDALFEGEHQRVRDSVHKRAAGLSRHLDGKPLTPAIKRKRDFLTELFCATRRARP